MARATNRNVKLQVDNTPFGVDWDNNLSATSKNVLYDKINSLGSNPKFSQTFGNGNDVSFTINHNLGTEDIVIIVKNTTTGAIEYPSVLIVDVNNIFLNFTTAPINNEYRATII